MQPRENNTSDETLIKWRVANSNYDRLKEDKDKKEELLAELDTKMQDWDGAKTLLELLKNYKLEKRKTFILKIINQALVDIFEEDYKIDIVPQDMKGKSVASTQKYDIVFLHNGLEIAKNADLLASNGGGVLSIVSLFFKVLIGYLYSKNKFFIFDESLSQVSPQYRERLSLFLREFCANYDFTLVVVSQTEELERHANLVYEVDGGVDEDKVPLLSIVGVEGEIPKTDYFYSEVTNFQSIKHLEFIYKGFTIIRGPNNSGKSASLRAIDSLLFNNFKHDIYQRKNPGGKRLETVVKFG
jgi:DNA repair exonuclease SbcCD ATPase subunit